MSVPGIVFIVLLTSIATESNGLRKNEERRCDVPCEKSCETLDILIKCVSEPVCKKFCKSGYVRDKRDGNCILPEDCPQCGENETYKSSGTDCAKCSNYQFVKCAPQNVTRCYCLPGYIREDTTNKCVRPEDCP